MERRAHLAARARLLLAVVDGMHAVAPRVAAAATKKRRDGDRNGSRDGRRDDGRDVDPDGRRSGRRSNWSRHAYSVLSAKRLARRAGLLRAVVLHAIAPVIAPRLCKAGREKRKRRKCEGDTAHSLMRLSR